jgi:hypothetical protein
VSDDLQPWQKHMLSGMPKGELKIFTAGRRAGKSLFTQQTIDRLMRDLNSMPIEELVLSEGTVYGSRYYCVSPQGGNWLEMEQWCKDSFGPTSADGVWTANMRWYANNRKFWFRSVKDRDWFIIRWRS